MKSSNKTLSSLLALLIASLILLSACASPTPPAPETASPTQPPAVEAVEAPAATEPEPADAASAEITLTDGLGRTVTLPGPAQKIVSLAPSNTEILFAIGAGSQVIGRDRFSDYPPEAQEVENIGGGLGELNPETIVNLQPDLVFAADTTAPEQVQALEDLGLTVYRLKNPTDLEGMYENLLIAGQLTGNEAEAKALVESLRVRVAAVEEKVAQVQERPLVFYELDVTDPNNPFTAGPNTFITRLIEMAGGENLGSALETEWAQISIESLLTRDPDIILLGDYTWGGVKPEDVLARENWAELSAVKNNQIYPFDDNLVSRPGPRMVDGLEQLAKLLHPDLFE